MRSLIDGNAEQLRAAMAVEDLFPPVMPPSFVLPGTGTNSNSGNSGTSMQNVNNHQRYRLNRPQQHLMSLSRNNSLSSASQGGGHRHITDLLSSASSAIMPAPPLNDFPVIDGVQDSDLLTLQHGRIDAAYFRSVSAQDKPRHFFSASQPSANDSFSVIMSTSNSQSVELLAASSDSIRIFFAVGTADPVSISNNVYTVSRAAIEYTQSVSFGNLRRQLGSNYNVTTGVRVQARCLLKAASNGREYWSALNVVTLRSMTSAGKRLLT